MKRLLLLVLLFALPGWAAELPPADEPVEVPVRLSSRLSPHRVRVGETVRLEVELRADPSVEIEAPGADELNLGSLELQDALTVTEGPGHQRFLLSLAGYEPGVHQLPPIPFRYRADGREGRIHTEPLKLEILGGGSALEDIRPARPPVRVPVPWEVYGAGAAVGALAVLCLAMLYRRLRRAVPLPPFERARHDLKELGKLAGSPALYDGSSHTLRRYLTHRLGMPLMELTSTEIVTRVDDRLQEELAELLGEADLVRFAGRSPGEPESLAHLQKAIRLVEKLGPIQEGGTRP